MLHPSDVARHLYSMTNRREGMTDPSRDETAYLAGASFAVVLVVLLLALGLYVWAVWALVKFWKMLHPVAKGLGVLFLLPFKFSLGPIGTLIVVYGCVNLESCNAKKHEDVTG